MLSLDEYSDKLSSEILAKGGFELSAWPRKKRMWSYWQKYSL